MKKNHIHILSQIKWISCTLILAISFSCIPEPPEIGAPFSSVNGISDEWVLVGIVQSDQLTKADENSIDLTNRFLGSQPATMSFSTNGTFSSNTGNSLWKLPLNSGNWSFDNDEFPSVVTLSNGGVSADLHLLAPVREQVDSYFQFRYIRPFKEGCSPDPESVGQVAYEYQFIRQN